MESRRSDAQITLAGIAAEQERIYTYDNKYTNDLSELGGSVSENKFYRITMTATDNTFVITATAPSNSSQFSDKSCRTLTMTHRNVKTSTDANGNISTDCW
ncbi:type IV pilin protein [Endozoicomonas ascidiicola]|uniref:type IV pilin protein n=1 Tax=Endozoicomonas ascidiicola TaxID=1698521 RepID=UPI000831619A